MKIKQMLIMIVFIIILLNKTNIIIDDDVEVVDISKEENYKKDKKVSIGYWNNRGKFIMY